MQFNELVALRNQMKLRHTLLEGDPMFRSIESSDYVLRKLRERIYLLEEIITNYVVYDVVFNESKPEVGQGLVDRMLHWQYEIPDPLPKPQFIA